MRGKDIHDQNLDVGKRDAEMKLSRWAVCLIICIFASLSIACLLPSSACAAGSSDASSNSNPTIKVGVLNNTDYAYQDEDGTWRGSDVECMLDIAQKAGFNVEFIDSTTDVDLFEHLDDGTYDILADMAQGADFKDNYLFTDEMIGTALSTIAVRADDDRWDYGNIEQLGQMKIGVIEGYATNADFRAWCAEHGIAPEIVEYPDIKVMSEALENGEIDGELYLAADGASYAEKFHTILRVVPEPIYFMFRKDDVELKNQVDSALAQILAGNSNYLTNLRNKYETQFNGNILPLSSAEEAYIAEHPTVSVAVVANDSPYYMKGNDGSDNGIIPDYYALIAEWSGLSFRYDVYNSYDEAIEAVAAGKSDMIGMFSNGLVSAYGYDLSLTDAFSDVNCILLTNSGTDVSSIKSIALADGTVDALRVSINRLYPDIEITVRQNGQDCFDALTRNETDAILLGTPSATWLINRTNSTSYNVIPASGITYDVCAAVSTKNQTLCSILNKGIAVTKGNYTGIATRDTMPQNDWRTMISRIPPAMSVLIVGSLMALVVGLIWAMVLLKRRQRERAAVLVAQSEAEQQRVRAEESEKNAEEKNAFFSNISHDMRTPLNAVIGFADLGENETSIAGKDAYFGKIKTSGKLLNSLIDDTLTISKMNSGKILLIPEPTKTSEMLKEIIDPVRRAAEEKNITFTVDDSEYRDRTLLIDRLNMQKIFLNLLSNAIKYTPEGGHINLKVYNDPPDDDEPDSLIEVSDDGIGISDEFLPHLFEPFSQERRHGYESVGTGLGLSIVKQLVEMMSGTITVKSEKDKGSTFTVRLHLEEAEPSASDDGTAEIAEPSDIGGGTVLLCEDNALNREVAIALLNREGFEVVSAENGQEGVQKFVASAEKEYCAILMDIRMPVMDGIEATIAIRALERPDARTIPIVAMTADAFVDDVQRCLDAGMNEHIAKPIDPQRVHTVLASLIKKPSSDTDSHQGVIADSDMSKQS